MHDYSCIMPPESPLDGARTHAHTNQAANGTDINKGLVKINYAGYRLY